MKVRGIGKKLFRVLSGKRDCDAMSYWLLSSARSVGIVIGSKDSRVVDCPFIHHCCGVETGARGLGKECSVSCLCSGRAAVILYIYAEVIHPAFTVDDAITGQLC